MNINEAKKHVKAIGLCDKPIVSRLGHGEMNDNFLVDCPNIKYVLRKSRKDPTVKSRLYNEHIILKFLTENGVFFTPQSVHWDKKKDTLITSFIPGKPCSVKDLSMKQANVLMDHLIEVEKLKFMDFVSFCKKNRFKKPVVESLEQNIKKYTIKPYKHARVHGADFRFLEWAEDKVREIIKLSRLDKRRERIVFGHGDLAGNLMMDKNNIYIIDWEFARFSKSRSQGGAWGYIFAHEDVPRELVNHITKKYAQLNKFSAAQVKKDIQLSMQKNMLNSTLWATQRYLEIKKAREKGWKKYYTLMLERMDGYDKKIKSRKWK